MSINSEMVRCPSLHITVISPRPQLQHELNSELKAVPKAHQQRNTPQRISVSMKCQHACLPLNQHLVLESLGYFTETIIKENYSIVGATSHPQLVPAVYKCYEALGAGIPSNRVFSMYLMLLHIYCTCPT